MIKRISIQVLWFVSSLPLTFAGPAAQAFQDAEKMNPPFPVAMVSRVAESTGEDARGSPLACTAWRLVKIMSMDDTVYVPEDPAL